MALTPFRWIAVLVAACLIGAAAVLGFGPRATLRYFEFSPYATSPNPLESRRNALGWQARTVARRLQLAQLLDSTHAGSAKGVTAPIRLLVGSTVPTVARAPLDSLVARATRDVRDSGRIGIDIFVVYDTTRMLRGVLVSSYDVTVDWVLPRRAEDRCAVMMRFGSDPYINAIINRRILSEEGTQQLLGPCKYYRAFGMPGRQIDSWLHRRAWSFAEDGSWSDSAMPVMGREDRFSYYVMNYDTRLVQVSADGANCERHIADACARAILDPSRQQLSYFNGNVLHESYFGTRWNYYDTPLGSRESFLFADMVRALGREKFARFWRSSESPSAAFLAAAGEPIGDWTSRWIAAQYGPPPGRGPGLAGLDVLASAMLVILGVFIGVRVNAHRHFV